MKKRHLKEKEISNVSGASSTTSGADKLLQFLDKRDLTDIYPIDRPTGLEIDINSTNHTLNHYDCDCDCACVCKSVC